MKKVLFLIALLFSSVLLSWCGNNEVVVEEEIVNDVHPVIALKTVGTLDFDKFNELNELVTTYLWNVELEQSDWTEIVVVKTSEDISSEALDVSIWLLEESELVESVIIIENDDVEDFVSSYDNWSLRELWTYINWSKEWIWTTYNEEWNIISSEEYVAWELVEPDDSVDVELPEWTKTSLTNEELDEIAENNFPKWYTFSTFNSADNLIWDEWQNTYREDLSHTLLIPEHAAMASREVLSSGIEDGMIYTQTEVYRDWSNYNQYIYSKI